VDTPIELVEVVEAKVDDGLEEREEVEVITPMIVNVDGVPI
jgi:hypothetical protein